MIIFLILPYTVLSQELQAIQNRMKMAIIKEQKQCHVP